MMGGVGCTVGWLAGATNCARQPRGYSSTQTCARTRRRSPVHASTHSRIHARTNKRTEERTHERTEERTEERTNRVNNLAGVRIPRACVCIYVCIRGCIFGWTDGWMDGWMYLYSIVSVSVSASGTTNDKKRNSGWAQDASRRRACRGRCEPGTSEQCLGGEAEGKVVVGRSRLLLCSSAVLCLPLCPWC